MLSFALRLGLSLCLYVPIHVRISSRSPVADSPMHMPYDAFFTKPATTAAQVVFKIYFSIPSAADEAGRRTFLYASTAIITT